MHLDRDSRLPLCIFNGFKQSPILEKDQIVKKLSTNQHFQSILYLLYALKYIILHKLQSWSLKTCFCIIFKTFGLDWVLDNNIKSFRCTHTFREGVLQYCVLCRPSPGRQKATNQWSFNLAHQQIRPQPNKHFSGRLRRLPTIILLPPFDKPTFRMPFANLSRCFLHAQYSTWNIIWY